MLSILWDTTLNVIALRIPFTHRLESLKDGFICINMRTVLWAIFADIIEKIVFESESPVLVGGETLANAVDKMLHLIFVDCMQNPINALTGGFLAKYNLIKPSRDARAIADDITRVLTHEYEKRLKSKADKDLGVNILDLIVSYNRAASSADQMSADDMVKNVINFQIAGVETSKNSSEFLLQHLARDLKTQSELYERIVRKIDAKEESKLSTYETNELLQAFTKEVLRLYMPVA